MFSSYSALAAAIMVGVAGQILLKYGAEQQSSGFIDQFLNRFTMVGLGAYALAAVFYIIAIKHVRLSIAFPSVSLSYAAVAIAAHYIWNEPLGWPQFAGIALIAGGILLIHQPA